MKYEVQLSDGRIVEVESGSEPTHEQLMSALGTWEEPQAAPAQQQLEPPSSVSNPQGLTADQISPWMAPRQPSSVPSSLSPSLIGGQSQFASDTSALPSTPREAALQSRHQRGPEFLELPSDFQAQEIPDPLRQEQPGAISRLVTEASTAPIGLGTFSRRDGRTIAPGSLESPTVETPAGMRPTRLSTPTAAVISALPEGKVKNLSAGVYNAGANVLNFFLSPLGVASLGIGNLPPIPQRAIAAKFAADMAQSAPDQLGAGDEAYKRGDMQAAAEHWLGGASSLAFAALGGAHAATPISKIPAMERSSAPPIIEEVISEPAPSPRRGELPELIAEEVKQPTQGVQNEAQSQVQLQTQQPEASRPSQVQERVGEVVQEQPESRSEVAPEPESVSPIVTEFISEYSKPSDQFKISNSSNDPNQITTAKVGESVKTIADLDALLKLNNDLREWVADFNQKKKEGRKATKEELDKFYSLGFGGIQFPREVVERAVNAGSGAKENKNQFEAAFENRPLDWRNNPEVADWLKKNAVALKITLPDELTASVNAPPSEAVAGETLAPAPSPETGELMNQLSEKGMAESKPQGKSARAAWERAIVAGKSGQLPADQLAKGINEAEITFSPKSGSMTIDVSGHATDRGAGSDLGVKHETVTVTVTEDGSLRMFSTGGREPRLLQFAIDKAESLLRGKPPMPPETKAVDWASATEDVAETAEPVAPGQPPKPEIVEMGAGIPIPKFADRKMSPLDRVTTSHSGKLQKSFSEARLAQKELKQAVPSDKKRNAISIYREAAGDLAVLKDWETRAKQKWMRDAARDAQSLTAKESGLLPKVASTYSTMETRGNTYDVLGSHRDNYVTHIWDVKQPGTGFGGGRLKDRFRFAKARTFNTFFEGDQAGFKPKTLDIAKLLPAYIHEMNRVIADRQAVRDLAKGTMPDGSPMVTPRGNAKVVDGAQGKAVLVSPKIMREADTSDYKVMADQPALSNWTWEGKDTDGNPVFVKADLAVHPDVYRRLNAMMGQSELRKWSRDPVTGTAQIPRAIVRGLDTAQSAMKREMFGLLAPFHQVQEGTHAVGHLVNPFFGLEKVDLVNNPKMADAANHGLMMLPDRASAQVYMEGVGTKSSLLSQAMRKMPILKEQIPGVKKNISDVIDGYQDYLFHQYIPALKYKTYEAMLGRNTKLYAKELASGEMTPADVKLTSAEQANAAYGHLNYALLDRNPTIQHFIQLGALAPDFLEARARFVGQGVKGLRSKVGHEQLKAIAILAAAQAGTAAMLSQLLGVDYDPEHPFEVIYKGRRYSMRSVPEDIFGLIKDTRQFVYSRVNPLTVKGSVQLATGLNYRGEKVSATETMAELLAGYIPITARSIPALRNLTETGRHTPVTPLQQLAGSLGLRISRYSPVSETYRLAGEWMEKQKLPKDRGSYPVSKYQQLRYALEDGDLERAKAEYETLKKDTPARKVRDGFKQSLNHPFTGSQADDKKFVKTLTGYDRELYDEAIRTRKNILKAFNSF